MKKDRYKESKSEKKEERVNHGKTWTFDKRVKFRANQLEERIVVDFRAKVG